MTKTPIVPGLDGSPAPHRQQGWAAPDRPVPAVREAGPASMRLHHPDSIPVGHSLGNAASGCGPWPKAKDLRDALLRRVAAQPVRTAQDRRSAG